MNLLTEQFPDDSPARQDGDYGFRGVNERLHPTLLGTGLVASAKNLKFTDGVAEPRGGIGLMPWGLTDGLTPFTSPYDHGVAKFHDSGDGNEWILIAGGGKVWRTLPNRVAEEMTLPAGVTLTAATFKMFVVCKSALVMLRGPDHAPLVCSDTDAGWSVIDQSDREDGTLPIPNSSFGFFFANRLIVLHDHDQVSVSDDGDYTRFVPFTASFQINEGDNEPLVSLAALDENTLIFLKRNSVWRVTNIGADLSAAVGPLLVTDQYGCLAPHSVVRVGRDLWWWSDAGMVGLRQTEYNEVQGREDRLTDDLPLTLRRIHQASQHRVEAAYHDGKVYIAVPLDSAQVLGSEEITAGTAYSAAVGTDTLTGETYGFVNATGLTNGVDYYYQAGSADDFKTSIVGATVIGAGLIKPTSGALTLYGTPSATVTASLRRVVRAGALTGMLVYDTRTQAWAGTVEGDAATVVGFWKQQLAGAERLMFLSGDGWLRLMDHGVEDEFYGASGDAPYVDLIVHAITSARGYSDSPSFRTDIQINGGSEITGVNATTNSGTDWAAGGTRTAGAARLWRDDAGNGGFDPTATSPWTAPDTTPIQIADGVRFTATNGSLPTVTINSVGVSETGYAGWAECLFLSFHSGVRFYYQSVATDLVTRAYTAGDPQAKQALEAVFHLSTWAPNFTLASVPDRVGRSRTHLADQSRSRTASVKWGGVDYDPGNAAGDHGEAGRQDYSVVLPATGMNLDAGGGINLELHQDDTVRVPVDRPSHWLQLRLSNTAGRVKLRGCQITAILGDRPAGATL